MIYVITAMRLGYEYWNKRRSGDGKYHSYEKRTSKSQKKRFGIIRNRTDGFFTKYSDAEFCVKRNGAILNDHEYNYLVIEEVECGGLMPPTEEWWYRWDNDSFVPTVKPNQLKNVVGFYS